MSLIINVLIYFDYQVDLRRDKNPPSRGVQTLGQPGQLNAALELLKVQLRLDRLSLPT